jgi:hypothetical protein
VKETHTRVGEHKEYRKKTVQTLRKKYTAKKRTERKKVNEKREYLSKGKHKKIYAQRRKKRKIKYEQRKKDKARLKGKTANYWWRKKEGKQKE